MNKLTKRAVDAAEVRPGDYFIWEGDLPQGNWVKESCGEEACEEVVVPGGGFAPKAE